MTVPTLLVQLNYADGVAPAANLVRDAAGDLFGTTLRGGTFGFGTVFEIPYVDGSYASTPIVLVSFNGSDGFTPQAGLIVDPAGDLFGTTTGGGTRGDGIAFEIPDIHGVYANTPTTLASFTFSNGDAPRAGLLADAAGDLFGTTEFGGTSDDGTVFEITKTGGTYADSPTTLVSFNGSNGNQPLSGLIMDGAGDLFGTTALSGAYGYGTVFQIVKTAAGYASTPTALASFNNTDGADPQSGLSVDAAGDLFGTTQSGGANGDGTVFEIAKTADGYASTPTALVSFAGADGANPQGSVIVDAAGDLFGTTHTGGANGDGTVFEIAKTGGSYAGTPTTLLNFAGSNGALPSAGLTADASGDLFGTTQGGGLGDGALFELTDTGFQVACYRRGTRIATPLGERAVETLAPGDLVLTESGEARPIAWVGHRRVDCRRHPRPWDVWPVRVHAGAIGPRAPRCDLWLSPDHAVFIDGVLIPVRYLINGATVVQETAARVSYWHVELDCHDVLLAEGLPCESYLDTGNRAAFANGGGAAQLHPDFALRVWQAKGCAPLAVGGPRLLAAQQRLLARAGVLGHATTDDPGLRVLAAGRAVAADTHDRQWRVRLPRATERVRLLSRAWVPAQMRAGAADTRRLGVAVARIRLDGRAVDLGSEALATGWHAPEPGWRWTDGDAALAPAGARELAFDIAITATYWRGEHGAQSAAAS
jgi:uncharacterized repeat protein (TIGR03803 family)